MTTRWRTNRRTKRKYKQGFLDVAPTHVRGGHTLSEHFGRTTEEAPNTFSRLLVSEKRKRLALRQAEIHRRKHKEQRRLEALRKKKPWLDYRPISEPLDEDEVTGFF